MQSVRLKWIFLFHFWNILWRAIQIRQWTLEQERVGKSASEPHFRRSDFDTEEKTPCHPPTPPVSLGYPLSVFNKKLYSHVRMAVQEDNCLGDGSQSIWVSKREVTKQGEIWETGCGTNMNLGQKCAREKVGKKIRNHTSVKTWTLTKVTRVHLKHTTTT